MIEACGKFTVLAWNVNFWLGQALITDVAEAKATNARDVIVLNNMLKRTTTWRRYGFINGSFFSCILHRMVCSHFYTRNVVLVPFRNFCQDIYRFSHAAVPIQWAWREVMSA